MHSSGLLGLVQGPAAQPACSPLPLYKFGHLLMLTLRGLRERQTQICVNMLGKLLTLALLMLALSKQRKGPPGAFQARAWKANNCSLGQEQTYYTLGLYSNISGQALLRKTCDDAASLPKPPAPQ